MPSARALPLIALTVFAPLGGAVSHAPAAAPEASLDARGWELVSPADKGAGQVGRPEDDGAGVFTAAAAGGAIAFGASDSFADGAGAPPVSQYLATRSAGGWSTANLSPPLLAGTYPGGAYQLFSVDLGRSLLSNGWSCRESASVCAAQNSSLDTDAPVGYRTLYLREAGGYQSLLTLADSPALSVPASDFELSLAGASPDLHQAVIVSCAALTADATDITGSSGCDPTETNLYRWSAGTLAAVNLLPGQTSTTPGASLAAPSGAISADGSRVYWSRDGGLYLREGVATKLVSPVAEFQAASADGALAYYLKAGHLYRFEALSEQSTDLTPSGGVQGVLAVSPAGSYVYYLAAGVGLAVWHGGASVPIAVSAAASSTPPATSTARVSEDGTRLAFLSAGSATGFPNAGQLEVFLYDAPGNHLICVSCNPFGATPLGPASLPGARTAAEGPPAQQPRSLSADGTRLFFETPDRLLGADTDGRLDVYQWEEQGAGSCAAAGGCVGMISSGRTGADSFLDASADGADAFFLTQASLVGTDTGGLDVYDARAGGGFSEAPPIVPCEGDACQGPAPAPTDLEPATANVEGPVNPSPRWVGPTAKRVEHRKKHRKHRHAKKGGMRG